MTQSVPLKVQFKGKTVLVKDIISDIQDSYRENTGRDIPDLLGSVPYPGQTSDNIAVQNFLDETHLS